MKLTNITALKEGINEITLKYEKYFIYKHNDTLTVYNSICPHQGARLYVNEVASTEDTCIHEDEEIIYCKVHNWRFFANGTSSNIQNARLDAIPHSVKTNGDIYLHIQKEPQSSSELDTAQSIHQTVDTQDTSQYNPSLSSGRQEIALPPPLHIRSFQLSDNDTQSSDTISSTPDIRIALHAHACLEFEYNNFRLICDPWLEGSAFMGAWRHYPAPILKTNELQPSMLYISHEHSDHCHIPTLHKLDKDIPIIIPSFPNARLEKILSNLGFRNIIALEFGKKTAIAPHFYITLFEPASLWNDSQALLEIEGFKILNINDSGINHRVRSIVKQADMLCSSFSPGASGYPATFSNINREEKIRIYEQSRIATLEMLKEACHLYNATYFLPFASHFILNHPDHRKYMKIIQKNTIYDVCRYLESSDVKVLPMLAGDSFELIHNKLNLLPRDDALYNTEGILSYITQEFDRDEFENIYPNAQEYMYDEKTITSYFLNLNSVPDIIFCEDLSITVLPDSKEELGMSFEIKDGCITLLDSLLDNANLIIKIPSEILMYICVHNESWDEATIGYWCEFERNPDIYHAEFWRLLQAPYFQKQANLNRNNLIPLSTYSITESSNVADVLERSGNIGAKILQRYGLYCLTCNKAPMESLKDACVAHGITNSRMQRMILELNAIC